MTGWWPRAKNRRSSVPRSVPRFLIVTPGVRPAGKDVDDHARATTPTQAISSGADYLVIGRPVRDASDPAAAAAAILTEMQTAFDARG